jgi:multidrug efflux pump subunit AcrA (membrane-fusion protein)
VEVVLPDGTTVTGKVSTVRTVSPPKDDAAQQGGGGEKPQTKAEVEIGIPGQKKLKGLDAATVDVKFISATAQKAMSVPVTALVALPDDGGYAVQVVEGGGRTRTVPVTLGLFAQGRVEITGKGLREGMRVGVPK